ncbi:MAG: hypothetical protein WEE89_02680 [Gemmatimonadota bacterium]
MRFVILGGGCYGSFYVQQLLKARNADALHFDEILVVDHNQRPAAYKSGDAPGVRLVRREWDEFFDEHLVDSANSDDQLVPSPFNPHLALGWLMRGIARNHPGHALSLETFNRMPGTPFQQQREHGTLVASHADWICPVHCIEPEICPHTRGPRFWDMDRTGRALAAELEEEEQTVSQVHLFHCHHLAYGVGAYPVAELIAARDAIEVELSRSPAVARFLVGTISRCHGAFHLLAVRLGMDTVSTPADRN